MSIDPLSSAPRHIVLLSPAYPLRGGIASSTERLATEWQNKGYQVEIFSFKLQYPDFLFPGKTQYAEGEAPEGLVIHDAVNSINPLNWIRVGRELRRRRPDLIIVRYWLPFMGPALGTILRLARGNGHTRVIALADNIIPHEKRVGDRRLTAYFCGSVDGFIVMSRSVEEDVRIFAPGKPVTYIPHPIYDNYGPKVGRTSSLEHLNLSADKRYLLFFGFIRRYKGLDLLLEAMADERLKGRPLHLLVAGEFYDDPAPYRALIDRLDLQDRVTLYSDYIPNKEVAYFFGAADLVVQPYRTATQSGISQLAYHFERPMIVTAVGGLPEIVEHGKAGYVVPVEPAAIAEAIKDFFAFDRLPAMTEGVQTAKTRFSWSRMVEGIVDMYRNLQEL